MDTFFYKMNVSIVFDGNSYSRSIISARPTKDAVDAVVASDTANSMAECDLFHNSNYACGMSSLCPDD